MRPRDVETAMPGGDGALVGVDQQGFDAGGSEIEPEIHAVSSHGTGCS